MGPYRPITAKDMQEHSMFGREMVVGFKRGKNLAEEKVDSALRLGGE
jgi:hypothetical protein